MLTKAGVARRSKLEGPFRSNDLQRIISGNSLLFESMTASAFDKRTNARRARERFGSNWHSVYVSEF